MIEKLERINFWINAKVENNLLLFLVLTGLLTTAFMMGMGV